MFCRFPMKPETLLDYAGFSHDSDMGTAPTWCHPCPEHDQPPRFFDFSWSDERAQIIQYNLAYTKFSSPFARCIVSLALLTFDFYVLHILISRQTDQNQAPESMEW